MSKKPASEAPAIRVLLFAPGKAPQFVETRDDVGAYRSLLGGHLDRTPIQVLDRLYQIWCDDQAYEKKLPTNRRLTYGRWAGHQMRGPWFVTRVLGDRDCSVDELDLFWIRRFVEF